MKDMSGRIIDYMRISITDRCNLRCRYCMPEGIKQIPMADILTYGEIERVCRAGVKLGISKYKITGGEPLVRKGAAVLTGMLKTIRGVEEVTLTTNGTLLLAYGEQLKKAGLDGVNISLDAMDRELYQAITGSDMLAHALAGIEGMIKMHIPVKLNVVLLSGVNDQQWDSLLAMALKYPLDVRFIELMPIGFGKEQKGISNKVLLEEIRRKYPGIQKDTRHHGNGPASYYTIPGFQGCVGFISPVHEKFCQSCNRIRLTSEGRLKPCLCYGESIDIRKVLRTGNEEALLQQLSQAIEQKPPEHCFEQQQRMTERHEMSQIGG